jgi:hypothetical protein
MNAGAASRFERVAVNEAERAKEREMGQNRFRVLVQEPFQGLVDTFELDRYGWGNVRLFSQYLDFSGVTFEKGQRDAHSCRQLYWVPYENASSVEALLPGWTMSHDNNKDPYHQDRKVRSDHETVDDRQTRRHRLSIDSDVRSIWRWLMVLLLGWIFWRAFIVVLSPSLATSLKNTSKRTQ